MGTNSPTIISSVAGIYHDGFSFKDVVDPLTFYVGNAVGRNNPPSNIAYLLIGKANFKPVAFPV